MEGKLQTKLKVAVRVRPARHPDDRVIVSTDKSTISIFNQKHIQENFTYKLPTVFDLTSLQKDVYSTLVQPEVNHILEGKNVSVFAYGATGSGKTHTMLGSPMDPGIIPRLIRDLFDSFLSQTEHSYKMTVSYLEIYNEKIRDLITNNAENLAIRQDVHQNIFVPNLTEKEVASFEDFSRIYGSATGNRTSAKTHLNANSSRSHSILLVKVIKCELETLRQCHISKVFLVDLAGSEDNHIAGNEGIRLKESALINKSLFAFTDVISAINQGNRHIPFRNSKLTRLLQNSLSGSSHVLMIANVAPEEQHYYDTYCTLNFASKQKKIVDNPAVGELATAYNIKLPNSKTSSLNSAKKKLNPQEMDKSKTPVAVLKQQMLKVEESLKNRPLLNVKVEPKDQKPELNKKETKDDKEKLRKRIMMKEDLKSRVRRTRSRDLKNPPLFKENTKREITTKYLRVMTTKDDDVLIENKQKSHRDHILLMLNSPIEKDLMLLHTVGKRRAQMIIEWTQQNGPFQQVEDLVQIPDLGQKYVEQFFQHNLLTWMDKENL